MQEPTAFKLRGRIFDKLTSALKAFQLLKSACTPRLPAAGVGSHPDLSGHLQFTFGGERGGDSSVGT